MYSPVVASTFQTQADNYPTSLLWPDLLITVDYDILFQGIDRSSWPALGQARLSTLSFSIGLTAHSDKVYLTADPIALYRGSNLLGGIVANVRQDIDTPAAATLGAGIFSDVRLFSLLDGGWC